MKKHLALAAVILLLAGGLAEATPFTLGSLNVTALSSDPGLVVQVQDLVPPLTFDLVNVGDFVTVDVLKIWTDESAVNDDDKIPHDIIAEFIFSSPSGTGTVEGQTVGKKAGLFGSCQWGEVTWSGPSVIDFGPLGGKLQVELSDEEFNKGFLWGTWPGPCRGAVVEGTFTLVQAGVIPEPCTVLLLGSGLVGLWALRRRKAA